MCRPLGGHTRSPARPLVASLAPPPHSLPSFLPLIHCPAAQEFALRLYAKQSYLLLTDSDLVCLEVAGERRM